MFWGPVLGLGQPGLGVSEPGTEQADAEGWMLELRAYQEATRDVNLCQPHLS